MKLPAVLLLSFGALMIASCAPTRGRTIELPGGGPAQNERVERAPNALERMLGSDDRRRNVGPCPLMGVLYDSSRVVQFAQPNVQRYANISFTGEMQGVRGLCRYVEADPITMSLDIDMAFGRGPASTSDRQTYRYWVAVTTRGRAPIAKEYYDLDVRFPRGEAVVTRTEHIERITIPRATADTSGENFEILVGFELTPDQLAFNRAGRRFRIDSGDRPPAAN